MHDLFLIAQLWGVVDMALSAWGTVWPYLVMLLGFSAIVFVHELGHFAVAKWAGVRVERFAVGFGREIAGFTRGETRYSFNILPLGGYVKMLGQEDFDDKTNELRFKDDPRSFVNKPIGHRMAIVSAGVVMNTLFAGLLFMIVFMIGMQTVAPRIGSVVPDSPAEQAGLRPGDYIRRINGETMLEFSEVLYAILLAPKHEPIEFVVERDGQLQPPIDIRPEYRPPEMTRNVQRQMVGIAPGVTREIVALGPEIDPQREDHPHVGDLLVEVDGAAVTDDNASVIFQSLVSSRGDIYVDRRDPNAPAAPPRRVKVQIPPLLSLNPSDPRDLSTVGVLGLTPLAKFSRVDPRGRAYFGGIDDGDVILRWDDHPHPSMDDVARAVRDRAEVDIPYRVRKAEGRTVEGFVRPKQNRRGGSTIQAVCKAIDGEAKSTDKPLAQFTEVRRGGVAERAGIEPGDQVLRCNKEDRPTSAAVNAAIRAGTDSIVTLSLRKRDGRVVNTVVQPQSPGSIDAVFTLVADDVLDLGEVLPTINGRPSPAAAAGIPAGARITAVEAAPVTRWRDLIDAFRAHAGATVRIDFTDLAGQNHSTSMSVPNSLHTLLGVGPDAVIVRIDNRETVTNDSPRGSETLSVRYHEGTRAALSGLIGRRQVPVEFRANPLGQLQTTYVDVTDDMVDPWVGRIAYAPSIAVDDQRRLLKGENALDAVRIGVHKTYYFIRMVYVTIQRMLFSRSVSVEQMSGPLGIIDMGGQVARTGPVQFLFFLAMISANLAVINFLPLPIVDGGLMVFLLIEKIKGSPVSLRVQVATQMIGLFLIIGMFLFVTYQDAIRLWG